MNEPPPSFVGKSVASAIQLTGNTLQQLGSNSSQATPWSNSLACRGQAGGGPSDWELVGGGARRRHLMALLVCVFCVCMCHGSCVSHVFYNRSVEF